MLILKKILLTTCQKTYCHNCCYVFGSPDFGFTRDGIDLCMKCYEELRAYNNFPTYLHSNICNFIDNIISYCKFIRSRVTHIHEWELDFDEHNYDLEYYVCLKCLGFSNVDSHTRWKWNPFIEWR